MKDCITVFQRRSQQRFKRLYNSFFNRHNNKDTAPVFAFRHPVVAQLKAEVNGKNCTPLRFVAFALCARLLLKTLIIPRVRLAIEFGSFFIYATILSFFVDFGDCDFNSHLRLLFSVLLRLCRKANKNGGIKCCI